MASQLSLDSKLSLLSTSKATASEIKVNIQCSNFNNNNIQQNSNNIDNSSTIGNDPTRKRKRFSSEDNDESVIDLYTGANASTSSLSNTEEEVCDGHTRSFQDNEKKNKQRRLEIFKQISKIEDPPDNNNKSNQMFDGNQNIFDSKYCDPIVDRIDNEKDSVPLREDLKSTKCNDSDTSSNLNNECAENIVEVQKGSTDHLQFPLKKQLESTSPNHKVPEEKELENNMQCRRLNDFPTTLESVRSSNQDAGLTVEISASEIYQHRSFTPQCHLAPEQALVTNVELVVPPPRTMLYEVCPTSLENNRFTTDILSVGSTLAETKTDGCATVSETKALISADPAIATTATSDMTEMNHRPIKNIDNSPGVAVTDNNTTSGIWAPHSDYKYQNPNSRVADNSDAINSNLNKDQSEHTLRTLQNENDVQARQKIYVHSSQLDDNDNYRMPEHQSHAEIFNNVKRVGLYPQMIHMQQYSHHQNLQQHPQHTADMYAQMLQEQHQQTINVQQQHHSHYASYSHTQQQYSHPQMFHMHPQDQRSHHNHLQHDPHQMQAHMQSMQHRPQQNIDVYHDLLIDEFPEDPNSAYKLGLSPNNVKPENQDDGYETSAGDVLTPNSHSSSTHSVTPHHQLQHGVVSLMAQSNTEDHQPQQQPQIVLNSKSVGNHHSINLDDRQLTENIHSGLSTEVGEGVGVIGNESYSFMGDDMRMLSPATRQIHDVNSTGYIGLSDGQNKNSDHFAVKHQPQPLNIQETDAFPQQISQQQQLASSTSTERVNAIIAQHSEHNLPGDLNAKPPPKRRGRKKKVVGLSNVEMIDLASLNVSGSVEVTNIGDLNRTTTAGVLMLKSKERKKHDRFNGMSEDEVIKRTIPDHLCENLDIVIVGINPGLFAAYKGHHYAGPGNHFWKCLYLSGLTQEQMCADEDFKLLDQGIGFTNMVARATKGSADLTRKEIKEGSRILLEKLQRYRPKIAVFNGKLIFEVFSGKKDFNFGRQPDCVEGTDTYIWVMPSSSARCAQLPRAADKVPFYAALKKFRDYLNGLLSHIDETECVFTEQKIKQCCEQQTPAEQSNQNLFLYGDNPDLQDTENVPNRGCLQSTGRKNHNNQSDKNMSHTGNENKGGCAYSNVDGMSLNEHTHGVGPSNMNENYISTFSQGPNMQEKKKRGRPKKIRGQEMNDPTTGNKVVLNNSEHQLQAPQHDFNKILNLSIMGVGNVNDEAPKKKRGRPKKQKPILDVVLGAKQSVIQQSHSQQPQGNVHPMLTLQLEQTNSPQNHLQQSLYNTPPPSHMLYISSASPMASPALNCTYTQSTPPVSSQATPPIMEQHMITDSNKTPTQCINSPTEQIVSQNQPSHVSNIRESHLGETPPPSSPNICAVDFETPTTVLNDDAERDSQERERQQQHIISHQEHLEKSRYASPPQDNTSENISHEHYQTWLSSQHQKIQSQEAQSPISHFGQFQHSSPQHSQGQQWQRQQQRYEELGNQYVVSPPHQSVQNSSPHHLHQQLPPAQLNSLISSDVARKSLSGLESLVDQIPSINETESNAMSSGTSAAAAVESRLLSLQQQQQQQQLQQCTDNNSTSDVQSDQFGITTSCSTTSNAVLNSSFSVSNLAASSTTNSNSANNMSQVTSLHNPNGEYGQSSASSSTGAYHHPNIISAALAAAAVNSSTSSAHHVTHPQMYMDPHMTHIAHVPVNAMYPVTGSSHHPHTHPNQYQPYSQVGSHGQHNAATNDYAPYSLHNATQGAALHMPSPNYPYGHHYGHSATQNNYVGYAHHPHHGHTSHHLSVFDRLKPSDLGGYGGF